MGCCYMPGSNCSCWYYGGLDWGMNKFPILASQYGQVVRVQDQGKSGYGKHVRMSHLSGSWTTIYAHLDSWNVTEGQMVEPGTVIGISGNTGNSTGPHLHWEVRENDKPVDPMPLMVEDIAYLIDIHPGVPPPTEPPDYIIEVPRVMITAYPSLRVRQQPNTNSGTKIWTTIPSGKKVKVIDILPEDNYEQWLQIGYEQYIAMYYQGYQYAIWVDVPQPSGRDVIEAAPLSMSPSMLKNGIVNRFTSKG